MGRFGGGRAHGGEGKRWLAAGEEGEKDNGVGFREREVAVNRERERGCCTVGERERAATG